MGGLRGLGRLRGFLEQVRRVRQVGQVRRVGVRAAPAIVGQVGRVGGRAERAFVGGLSFAYPSLIVRLMFGQGVCYLEV